ncbi:MAG: transglycosylase domain-containing protein [Ginsengibacter sp.]
MINENEEALRRRKGSTKKKPIKKGIKILWTVVFTGIAFFLLMLVFAMTGLFGALPSIQQLENPQANLASELYTDNGKTLMGKIYAENRSPVDYKDISHYAIDALVSTEDIRFYDHSGIDIIAIARALKGLGHEGGGSTITQQLAKNMLGQGHGWIGKRAVDKLKEWIVALKLERNFTKQEIISLYLNRVPWGNIYGIRNASRTYFQKEPRDLAPEEAALLIGMLNGPSQYDPIRHPKAALYRRNLVLERMNSNDALKDQETENLKAKPIEIKYKKLDENLGIAPYFRMVMTKKLVEWCKQHKDPKTGNNYDVYRDGLKIYTTINPKMQEYAEEAVARHMTSLQKVFNSQLSRKIWNDHQEILNHAMRESERWKTMAEDEVPVEDIKKYFYEPIHMKIFAWNQRHETDTVMTPIDSIKYLKQMMQSSFMAMDPVSGEVRAWVGGIDFKWFKFDHATNHRQVGSTFKPLLYTVALMDAGVTPDTYIGGRSITLADKTITGKGGTMAYCLAKSLNAGAYDLMSRVGPKKTAEFAHLAGIKSDIPIVPSIALGSADLTLEEMLHAYTMFPNRGFSTEPIMLSKIEDKNGNVIESFQAESKQVISENDAYTMYKMMQGVVDFGTGHAMRDKFNIKAAMGGKTGTTNDNTDGWFIGYTPQILAGGWVGNDDPFLKIRWTTGANELAMPEWAYFMQKVFADKTLGIDPNAIFQKPADLDNNPIYADKNFADIIKRGSGTDEPDNQGNGEKSDYTNDSTSNLSSTVYDAQGVNTTGKKDSSKDKKNVKQLPILNPDDKKLKPKPVKSKDDY